MSASCSAAALIPLRCALLAAKVPRHYVRALLEELGDHVRDDSARRQSLGTPSDAAWREAVASLGAADDIVEQAVRCTRAFTHRAPSLTLIVGPAIVYTFLATLLAPALAFLALGERQMQESLVGVAAWSRLFAVAAAALLVCGFPRLAERFPGTGAHATIGTAVTVALCGALRVATTPDLSEFVVRYTLSIDGWQLALPLGVLLLRKW